MTRIKRVSVVAMGVVGLACVLAGGVTASGTLAHRVTENEGAITEAEQDARLCEWTEGCDVDQAWGRVDDLKAERDENKAIHYDRAWKAGVVAAAGGLLVAAVLRIAEGWYDL